MIPIDGSHIIIGVCPPYPLRPKGLACPVLYSALESEQSMRGEQPTEPPSTGDIFPNDADIPAFGCQGPYPPKREVVSVDFDGTVENGMTVVDSDPVKVMDGREMSCIDCDVDWA